MRALLLYPLLLAIILLIGGGFWATPAQAQDGKESVYDRVMRTGEIRCGYLPWKDFVDIDPNTGEFSGIVYDYMEALAHNLNLKLSWVEEVGRGDYTTALENNRFDVYCTALTGTAERSRMSDFIQPIAISLFNVYAQAGDTRFDNNPSRLNKSDITMVAAEGDVFSKMIKGNFPNAKLIELPQLMSDVDPLLYVQTEKADAAIMNANVAYQFIKSNPEAVQEVRLSKPFRYVPMSVATKTDEYRFTKMLDVATRELLHNGTMDKIMDKYDPDKKAFLRIAKPYEATSQ